MPKDIESILANHGVAAHASGANEILVHCPLCGASDQGAHLSISLRRRGWRCLRNPRQHRGASYAKLLTHLLNCSFERAKELLGEEMSTPLPDNDTFASTWRKQLGLEEPETLQSKTLRFPSEFRRLQYPDRRAGGFFDYLEDRGYDDEQTDWACEQYDLHYALSGRYSYRIIIPVYSAQRKLLTWTARSINPKADVRYLTLSSENALVAPGEALLGLPLLMNPRIKARCLVVCEGPFDAIAISTLGHEQGVWGTCLFGLELSEAQGDLLSDLSDRFERTRLLIDPDMWTRLLGLRTQLARRCGIIKVPRGFKDPGEFVKRREGREFVQSLAA